MRILTVPRSPVSVLVSLPVTLLLAACPPKAEDSAVDWGPRGDCNPVDDAHCLLPFPSSFYLEDDASTPTGFRVAFGSTSLPENVDGVRTDPTYWNEKDGFPTLGSLFLDLPGAVDAGLAGHTAIAGSVDPASLTVILDAETGERIPHFAEVDCMVSDEDRQPIILRPVTPLRNAARYVVGVRGVVDAAGTVLDAPSGFAALRDGTVTEEPDLERQRAHYDDGIFPVLEAAGFARDDLQMAWDFVTVSKENTVGRALAIRDDALADLPAGGPPYTILSVDDGDCLADDRPAIGRTIEGTFTSPLYLTSWDPGSLLTRGEDGMPYRNGETEVPFTIRIPCSLILEPRPARLLQYGHGLLGDRSEVRTGWLSDMADRYGWVLFGTDWTGMKSDDVTTIMAVIGNGMNDFATVPERTQHAYLEFLLAGRMMLGDMATDPNLTVEGVSLVDAGLGLSYYGVSQGAILGGGYAAFSPDLHRVVFGVGGTPYSLLLSRSSDFTLYLSLLGSKYDDAMDVTLIIGLMQMLWDPGETAGWARYLVSEPVDDITPNKVVLSQVGIGDAQVPSLGGQVAARAFGASLLDDPVREVWGLPTVASPVTTSAYVEFDYGVVEPEVCAPGDHDTDTHESPRREEPGQEQIRAFLEEGRIENYCDGACDPD